MLKAACAIGVPESMVDIALRNRSVLRSAGARSGAPKPASDPAAGPGPPPRGPPLGRRPGWIDPQRKRRNPGRRLLGHVVVVVEVVALLAGGVWATAELRGAFERGRDAGTVISGVKISGMSVSGLARPEVVAVADTSGSAAAERPMTLVAGRVTTQATASELGATPWPDAAVAEALAVGRSGDVLGDLSQRIAAARGEADIPIGYRLDESRGLERLIAIAPLVETPSLPTQLDFETRKIIPAKRGTTLLAYDSLSAVAVGLARGSNEVTLAIQEKPAVEDSLRHLVKELDISVVLGSFNTPYQTSAASTDRTHNLKVGATAIDGKVLMPGEVFSFNEVVGERSAQAGYRYATGISGGELVDVLGGGICQVSSTVFGAGFFGGLGVVSARPHSRPSSYVDMGLDSTVVWPSVDMKLRNDYDFPVVFHMSVSQGKVRGEVLGPRRPYQVAFERELDTVLPYKSVVRDDARLLVGTTQLAQRGRRGFKVKRHRRLLQAGDVVAEQVWELTYPSTTEIVRRGTSATGRPGETKKLPALRDPAPHLKIVQ